MPQSVIRSILIVDTKMNENVRVSSRLQVIQTLGNVILPCFYRILREQSVTIFVECLDHLNIKRVQCIDYTVFG